MMLMSEDKIEEKKAEPVSPQLAPAPTPPETKTEAQKVETPKSIESKTDAPKVEAPYKAIIMTDTCVFCQGLKDYIKDKGLGDKVKIINASTPEGRKFAIDNKIRGVPECIVVDQGGKPVKVCSREEFVKLLKEGN